MKRNTWPLSLLAITLGIGSAMSAWTSSASTASTPKALQATALPSAAERSASETSSAPPGRSASVPGRTAPAIVEDQGSSLRRSLIARLEFEELGLKLVGISNFQNQTSCFIKHPGSSQHMIYKSGAVIGGYRIDAIQMDSVTFERDGMKFWVMLGETSDGRSRDYFEAKTAPADLKIVHQDPQQTPAEALMASLFAEDPEAQSSLTAAPSANPAPTAEIVTAAATAAGPELAPGAQTLADAVVAKAAIDGIESTPAEKEPELKVASNNLKKKKTRGRVTIIEDEDEDEVGAGDSRAQAKAGGKSAGSRQIASGGPVRFITPLRGEFTSGYGYRRHPVGGYRRFHKGVDIAGPYGSTVSAAAGGVVTRVRNTWTFGLYVMVDHGNGYETVYAHLSKALVREGQRVSQGDAIAKEGSSGISTGPHLHFEVRKNGVALDPENYIKRSR